MYYTYVLISLKDHKFYTGYTSDIEKRLQQHNDGEVFSTKSRRPFKLIYFEACLNQDDALHREKYLPCGINRRFNAQHYSTGLKTTYGKRYIRNRLKIFLNENPV